MLKNAEVEGEKIDCGSARHGGGADPRHAGRPSPPAAHLRGAVPRAAPLADEDPGGHPWSPSTRSWTTWSARSTTSRQMTADERAGGRDVLAASSGAGTGPVPADRRNRIRRAAPVPGWRPADDGVRTSHGGTAPSEGPATEPSSGPNVRRARLPRSRRRRGRPPRTAERIRVGTSARKGLFSSVHARTTSPRPEGQLTGVRNCATRIGEAAAFLRGKRRGSGRSRRRGHRFGAVRRPVELEAPHLRARRRRPGVSPPARVKGHAQRVEYGIRGGRAAAWSSAGAPTTMRAWSWPTPPSRCASSASWEREWIVAHQRRRAASVLPTGWVTWSASRIT